MKNKYYSQFPQGFTELVSKISNLKIKGNILSISDDYLFWESDLVPEQVSKIDFLETSFLVINTFDKAYGINNQLAWINNNLRAVESFINNINIFKHASFRVVVSQVGKHSSIYNNELSKLESKLGKTIKIEKGSPDFEIRMVEKKDFGFIGVRISKTREYIDNFQVNSVRKEIAYYMNFISEPNKNDIFIDPMCGGGIIPILRSKMGNYKKIVACDSRMNHFIGKVRIIRKQGIIIPRVEYYEIDFKNIPQKIKFKFNKVVVDPPWGIIQKIKDINKFYRDMFKMFEQICEKRATVVILVNDEQLIRANITDAFEICEVYKGLVSGREASIIKLKVNR